MSDTNIDLSGQVALVTGGGQGLGRGFAQALALAGAAVAVTARSEGRIAETVKLIEEKGGKAIAIAGDVIEQSDVERIVAAFDAQYAETYGSTLCAAPLETLIILPCLRAVIPFRTV